MHRLVARSILASIGFFCAISPVTVWATNSPPKESKKQLHPQVPVNCTISTDTVYRQVCTQHNDIGKATYYLRGDPGFPLRGVLSQSVWNNTQAVPLTSWEILKQKPFSSACATQMGSAIPVPAQIYYDGNTMHLLFFNAADPNNLWKDTQIPSTNISHELNGPNGEIRWLKATNPNPTPNDVDYFVMLSDTNRGKKQMDMALLVEIYPKIGNPLYWACDSERPDNAPITTTAIRPMDLQGGAGEGTEPIH